METLPRERRQLIGCGYEPAFAGAKPWQPPGGKLGYKQRPLPVICAGYTTRLPEVVEVARAYTHWLHGSLQAFCGGEPPNENLVALLELYHHEVERSGAYWLTSKENGGGRD